MPQGCYRTRDPPQPSLFREGWGKVLVSVDKFSREFSAKYHRKLCKLSSEARNSLENFSLPMIPLALKIVLFLTQSEWSTQRIIYKLPPYSGRAGVGLLFGGSLVWWVSCLGGSLVWVGLFRWHPCGTRDTLSRRVYGLYTKAMWHPCTLNLEISRVRA